MIGKTKLLLTLLGLAVSGGAIAYVLRRKGFVVDPAVQADVHKALMNPNQSIPGTTASSGSGIDVNTALKAAAVVTGTAKAIAASVVGTAATTGGAAATTTATTAAATTTAEAAATETLTAGGSVAEATQAAAASVGVQLLVGIAPLILLAALANAWGVFDPWDPHAGFQKLTLSRDLPSLNLKAGDIVDWVPDAVYDQVMAGNINALDAFFVAQVQKNEALQAGKLQIQRNIEAAASADAAAAAAAQRAIDLQRAADEAASAQARSIAQQQADLAAQQAAAAAAKAAQAAAANTEASRQAIALKNTGSSGTKFSGFGRLPVRRATIGFGTLPGRPAGVPVKSGIGSLIY